MRRKLGLCCAQLELLAPLALVALVAAVVATPQNSRQKADAQQLQYARTHKPPPPSPPPTLAWAAPFSSSMVLAADKPCKVYGFVTNSTGAVSIGVRDDATGASYTVVAAVRPADLLSGFQTADGVYAGQWVATLRPTAARAVVTITAAHRVSGAPSPGGVATLERVTFGLVYLCGGQSNMALPIVHTFSSETLRASVLAGKYSNLHIMKYGDMSVGDNFRSYHPKWCTVDGRSQWWNLTAAANEPEPTQGHKQEVVLNSFHTFSATCLYFGVALSDQHAADGPPPPIGLIQSAVGGSMIEQWVANETLADCTNLTASKTLGRSNLFYGMIAPFVNMSISGWVFYQGENNCGGDPGLSSRREGYGLGSRIWGQKRFSAPGKE